MRRVALALSFALLAGCFEPPQVHSDVVRTFKLVDLKRPKHFRVMLQDVQTGRTQWVSISKHCNRWREVEVGSLWLIHEVTYVDDGEYWTRLEGVRAICPGL